MANVVYTLKKCKETEELHLFRATPTQDGKCTPEKQSICEKMDVSESEANIFACQKEDAARISAANQGRKVCGICVSHLYETYD
jgi:hypothetical protein